MYKPQIGDYVVPDGWRFGEVLKPDSGYSDSEFPGCAFRLPSTGGELAINIKVTGKDHFITNSISKMYRTRIRIEFVGDGEPSTFTGGWLFHD